MSMYGPTAEPPADPRELERDLRLEALLDEMVASAREVPLPADFSARVLLDRPFAPWEVRQARHWKVPALAGGGLLAASLGAFATPLWSLGPVSSVTLWANLMVATILRPVLAAVSATPLLAEAMGRVRAAAPGSSIALLAGLVVLGLVPLVYPHVVAERASGTRS